ncbi:MAG: asparagine synthase (glutamine-hydrolyzing) [Chloroflexota bacterium]|nr:asparagine synthase (glutamine-hydrolyzing) [Chloroflexota bacterium]
MCGIVGMIDVRGHGRADAGCVRAMAAAIQHRGPDGDGFHESPNAVIGMRRLSIIDVTGSDQPLYNEDRALALVFNGEIYNYRELRDTLAAQGHMLRTDGDGETLLHLYEQHGLDLFTHLRGMYAFALWDSTRERLVLAVDHIGMKPLYLYQRDGLLWFASEVKAFSRADILDPALNLDTLDTYLSFGYMIGEHTLFRGVRRLMPGHVLVVENGEVETHEYWRFGTNSSLTLSQDVDRRGRMHPTPTHDAIYTAPTSSPSPLESGDEVSEVIPHARQLIAESVRLHLRSDVPLGLFLSGGVDSAAVLALMSQEAGGRVKTFTVGYEGNTPDNELAQAGRVAAHFGTDHHARVITAEDWWTALEGYVYHHDEPNANASAVSLMLLAQETARHVKVVLTGLGGDELFGGYAHHRTLPGLIGSPPWRPLLAWLAAPMGAVEQFYPAFKRYRYIGALPTYLPRLRHALLPPTDGTRRMLSYDGMVMSDALRQRLYAGDLRQAWEHAHHKEHTFAQISARSQRDTPENTAQALIINTWLHGNALLNCDKVTMAHSLEARVPFFDPALLAFAADVPPAVRMQSNKYVLREAMRPYLPAFALERPKQPFGTPIRGWFDGVLKPRIADLLLDGNAHIRRYFSRVGLGQLLRAHFDGREKHEEIIFRLLLLEMWLRGFASR